MKGAWTDDRLTTVARLWNEGLSAAQISRALGEGVSRSAVCGKLFRLGLTRTEEQRALLKVQNGRRMTRLRRVADPDAPPRPPRVERGRRAPEAVPDRLVALMDLKPRQCRWPFGDPQDAGFGFCGGHTVAGEVYCPAHRLRARPLRPPPLANPLEADGLAAAWAPQLSTPLERRALTWLAARAGREGWGRLKPHDLTELARACGADAAGAMAALRGLNSCGALHLAPGGTDYVLRPAASSTPGARHA